MEQRIIKSTIGIVILLFLSSTLLFAQTITINAGSNQIINWEKTHSAQLKGSVTSGKIKTEWTCPQNSEVVFQDASNPVTQVTFPRPGYYLLILSSKKTGGQTFLSGGTDRNVRPPGSCVVTGGGQIDTAGGVP